MNGDGCFRAVYTESSPTCLHRVKEITVREKCRFIDDNCISVYSFYFYIVVFKQENFNFSFHSSFEFEDSWKAIFDFPSVRKLETFSHRYIYLITIKDIFLSC